MIDEHIYDAREELKRVDHLIFVSLKYTRTCDVMRSIVERLISTYDNIFLALLNKLKTEKKITAIPPLPAARVEVIRNHFQNESHIIEEIQFYLMLRRFNLCKEFTRTQEFRRNVTMTMEIEEKTYELTIDVVTEFYKRGRSFLEKIYESYFKLPTED